MNLIKKIQRGRNIEEFYEFYSKLYQTEATVTEDVMERCLDQIPFSTLTKGNLWTPQ